MRLCFLKRGNPFSIAGKPWIILFLAGVVLSCSHTYGVYHEVGSGENFYRISKTYNINMQELAEINDIEDASQIRVGQRIFIPGAKKVKRVGPSSGPKKRYAKKSPGKKPAPSKKKEKEKTIQTYRGKFIWPVKEPVVTSRYGPRKGNMHDGIDIGVKKGTPIRASASGRVIYSDNRLRGYGKMIIVKHEGVFSSVYAHNHKNYVKQNDFVEKGEVIALVGQTGRATGPHLHFEIRKGRKAVNPLFYLPKNK